MDIMRLLTRKLKLEDAGGSRWRRRRTFPEEGNYTMQATEFDSGTASDEDATEFEEEPRLNGVEAKLNCEAMHTAQLQLDRTAAAAGGCISNQLNNTTSYSSSAISQGHPVFSSAAPASKDPGAPSAGPAVTLTGRLSAVSSDFERCSLDFEPLSSSSCSEVDHHSSEEELVSIYRRRREQKRKRSQMSRDSRSSSSGAEDEELDAAERFPQDCDRRRPLSSSCGLRDNDAIPLSAGRKAASGVASPWKRHRQTTVNSTAIQRPSLDLYKMQKTSITRKFICSSSSSGSRPRVVKIRTISGSSRPAKSGYNPSVFCFRSISWASSRLKEEPFRAF